jgi:hypothetical protein
MAFERAIDFAFPGRKDELAKYFQYIQGLFAQIHAESAHNVINCDKAIRTFIGSARQHLFDDILSFGHIERSHLIPGMANYQSADTASKGKDVSGGSKWSRNRTSQRDKAGSYLQICRNWNKDRCSNDGTCKRVHVCSECRGNHRKSEKKCPTSSK